MKRPILSSLALLGALGPAASPSPPAELPPEVPAAWWSAVRADLVAREYRASVVDGTPFDGAGPALQAPNRAQGLRTWFTEDGVRLARRTADAASWSLGMALTGVGRGASVAPPAPAAPTANGNRVEYRRGGLVEWYVNDERGVEQGFDLARRPDGPADAPLRIELTLSGDLAPTVGAAAAAVEFADADGATAITLSKLIAWDRTRRSLPARFELDGATLALVVDDADALYPIVVDPLASTPDWTKSNGGDAYRVATAGDVNGDGLSDVIISSPALDTLSGSNSQGRAWVFHAKANGTGLGTNAAWTATFDGHGVFFGESISTAGDVNGDGFADVIVGAPGAEIGSQTSEGLAFVYHGSPSGLGSDPAWTAQGGTPGARLGTSVSTAGDVNGDGYSDVILGAPFTYSTSDGQVLVHFGSATGLVGPPWKVSGPDHLGTVVSTAGDVNGDGYSDVVACRSGGAVKTRVYHGSAAGLPATHDWATNVGGDAATAGDVNGDGYADLLVSFDSSFAANRVECFLGSATGLGSAPAWTRNGFRSVSSAGDVNGDGYADVILGNLVSSDSLGRVSLFLGSRDGLASENAWTYLGTVAGGHLGLDVACAGDVNGDGLSDVMAAADDGPRAVVFHGGTLGPQEVAGWSIEHGQIDAGYGFSVASAGDVDGDGYGDVVVGAPNHDAGHVDEGKVWVYHGSGDGLATSASWTYTGQQAGARFGISVACAGDVNGDGLSDLVVGAPGFDGGQVDEGAAVLFLAPLSLTGDLLEIDQAGAGAGTSVASAGDVDGDGFADVIVGAPNATAGLADEGRADVWLGDGTGSYALKPSDWHRDGGSAGARFGFCVASAGDVNRDGFSDVVVGAPNEGSVQADAGRVEVWHGRFSGLSASSSWSRFGDQAGANLGYSVASAGDVNGDGYSDVIVGAWKHDGGEVDEGGAWVHRGSATGLESTASWAIESDVAGARLGRAVASAGDVNGDGFGDVIVGADLMPLAGPNHGRATVHLGSSAGLSVEPDWIGDGAQPGDRFGFAVASAGDVNGDGYGDVLIGAKDVGTNANDAGAAFLHYGNGGLGRDARPRQRREDHSSLVASLGAPDTDQIWLSAKVGSPFGRSLAALELEVKPLGVPFDGVDTETTAFSDATGIGVGMKKKVSVSALGSYHWRARMLYDVATSPYQRRGRWFGAHGNATTEADFRQVACPTPAAATPYGSGKAGTNGVPTLSGSTPTLGGTFTLTLANGAPGAAGSLLFVGLAPIALPFDGGTLQTSPLLTLDLPPLDAAGGLSLPAALEDDPASCGFSVFLQAFVPDPAAGGFYGMAMSNGLELTFGH
ncbi:MAG: FG-GAP-like repeat-containing protein [Planctomycetota bacterium JB042]